MTDDKDFGSRPEGFGATEGFIDSFGPAETAGIAEIGTAGATEELGVDGDVAEVLAGKGLAASGQKLKAALRARLGEDVYTSWFGALELDSFDGTVLTVSVPVVFLRKWIQTHYADQLLACSQLEFAAAERVEVVVREPVGRSARPSLARPTRQAASADTRGASAVPANPAAGPRSDAAFGGSRTQVNGFEGSPLDPRYTFESFVVGPSNRMAHAGAVQVAETVFSEQRGFNPLFVHSSVGHGKSHLLHAVAWEVRRRTPHAKVLYLTAERFRFTFVEALKSQDAMAFKERFRAIDMLLVDDLEFMTGEKTELEFDHIINMLLDGGRQLVVASARPPSQLGRLNDRMRSRLQRGLVTELGSMDLDLRVGIVERRVQEKRAGDPSFEIPRPVLELIADKLTESGRELEGAVNRIYMQWQVTRSPITLELVESILRDLVCNGEARRIRIDDILRIISRHYGVSRGDILSQRRHRSVVLPRQIGMYLAKQLTARSLPEIGRRFGGRDHTTVLHAIRKIENVLTADAQMKDEIEDLKKQLAPDPGTLR